MARKVLSIASCLIVLLIGGCKGLGKQPRPVQAQDGFAQCKDEAFKIDLLNVLDALPDDSAEARSEQLRDWVWRTLLARLAVRGAGPELLASVAKQPLLRDESLAHILDVPVGRGRAAVDKQGTVYVLVERSSPRRTREDVLEAIDQEALLLGSMPKAVEIYGVAFDRSRAEAEICRLGSHDQEWLRSPRQDFRHAKVSTVEGLASFLKGGVDLLSASCTAEGEASGVELTGRVRTRDATAPITVEHIAALQSEPTYAPIDRLPVEIPPEARAQAGTLGAQLDEALRLVEEHKALLPRGEDAESEKFLARILEWKRQNPDVPTSELILSLQVQTQGIDNLGFSLDPRTDTLQAAALLDRLLGSPRTSSPGVRTSLRRLQTRVAHADQREGERLLLEAEVTGGPFESGLVQEVLQKSGYQCARYDGPVAGTKSAMTMFYTDLLAKLWAINWRNVAPTGLIPGFVSVPEHPGASTYCEQDEGVPYTRIWFGSRHEGFTRDSQDKVRFAPNATRLFAMGSAFGPEHSAEVEPSADMLRFIRWWDRNYSDVAEWEPQYELLNQLVKWTLVQRMAQAAPTNCLSFLSQASAGRTERFDHWLARQKDVRWQGPLPAVNKQHEKTECLNLFKSAWFSRCGNLAMLSGGVGLPTREEYSSRRVRAFDTQPFSRQIDPEKLAIRSPDGVLRYPSIERPKGSLDDAELTVTADRAQLTGKLRSTISFRGDYMSRLVEKVGGAYRKLDFRQEDRLVDHNTGLESQESIDGFGAARLHAADLRNGKILLTVGHGVQSEANRMAREVGLRLRPGRDDLPTIAQQVAGELPVYVVGPEEVIVHFHPGESGEGVYAIMSSGGGVRGPPTGGGRWSTGNPETPRYDGHNGWWNSNHRINVVLLPEKEGKDYLQRQGAEPVTTSAPVIRDIREKLSRGDLAAARAVVETPGAPTWAVATVALHAIEHGRYGVAEEMVRLLPEQGQAAAEFRRIEPALVKAQIQLTRTDNNPQALLVLRRMQVVAAFKIHRLSLADAETWKVRNGEKNPYLLYASAQFKDARLPSVTHRPAETLQPDKSFVLDVVADAELVLSVQREGERRSGVPKSIEIDGVPLQLRESLRPTQQASPDGMPGGEVDFFPRIPPILVVRRCSTEGEGTPGLPSCYRSQLGRSLMGSPGPGGPGGGRPLDFYLEDCDLDGDGSLDEGSETDCAKQRMETEQSQLVSREP
jgi:hypothetical protein